VPFACAAHFPSLPRQVLAHCHRELDVQIGGGLHKEGQSQHVQEAIHKLPEEIDHNQHAALLQKFGLDPGKLAEKAAERGLSRL
jgi:hypothetical protein